MREIGANGAKHGLRCRKIIVDAHLGAPHFPIVKKVRKYNLATRSVQRHLSKEGWNVVQVFEKSGADDDVEVNAWQLEVLIKINDESSRKVGNAIDRSIFARFWNKPRKFPVSCADVQYRVCSANKFGDDLSSALPKGLGAVRYATPFIECCEHGRPQEGRLGK
ncbi:protein of unknown function [Aminobacter niigataensis]|nr:protein of unknown function [Aminobacter niigataensis]